MVDRDSLSREQVEKFLALTGWAKGEQTASRHRDCTRAMASRPGNGSPGEDYSDLFADFKMHGINTLGQLGSLIGKWSTRVLAEDKQAAERAAQHLELTRKAS
jgi:hypothetical protein